MQLMAPNGYTSWYHVGSTRCAYTYAMATCADQTEAYADVMATCHSNDGKSDCAFLSTSFLYAKMAKDHDMYENGADNVNRV